MQEFDRNECLIHGIESTTMTMNDNSNNDDEDGNRRHDYNGHNDTKTSYVGIGPPLSFCKWKRKILLMIVALLVLYSLYHGMKTVSRGQYNLHRHNNFHLDGRNIILQIDNETTSTSLSTDDIRMMEESTITDTKEVMNDPPFINNADQTKDGHDIDTHSFDINKVDSSNNNKSKNELGGVNSKGFHINHSEVGNVDDTKGNIININNNQTDRKNNNNINKGDNDDHNIRVIYVHVGKTGGTTLNYALQCNCEWKINRRSRQECLHTLELQKERSKISNITKVMLHGTVRPGFDEWNNNAHNKYERYTIVYLVTIRNPINRVVSDFNYEHPRNYGIDVIKFMGKKTFYEQCFPTIEDMATILDSYPPPQSNRWRLRQQQQQLSSQSRLEQQTQQQQQRRGLKQQQSTNRKQRNPPKEEKSPKEVSCAEIGRAKLHGFENPFPNVAYHTYANYAYYGNLTYFLYPQREIWAIRTEHLWDDMNYLEQTFLHGMKEDFYHTNSSTTHGSEGFVIKSKLSSKGMKTFCCELYDEIQIYQYLLHRSTNLRMRDKEESMKIVFEQCDIPINYHNTVQQGNENDVNIDGKKGDSNKDNDDDEQLSSISILIENVYYNATNFSWSHWADTVC